MMDNIKTVNEIKRDEYYYKLMKQYDEWDCDNLIDMISDEENEIREKLETVCMVEM